MKKKFPYYAYMKHFTRTDFFAVGTEFSNMGVQIFNDNSVLTFTDGKVPFDATECTQVEFIHAYEKAARIETDKFHALCPLAVPPYATLTERPEPLTSEILESLIMSE